MVLPPTGDAPFAEQAEMAENALPYTLEQEPEQRDNGELDIEMPGIPADVLPKSPETSPNLASYGLW